MRKFHWLGTIAAVVLLACSPQVVAQEGPAVLQAIQFPTNGDLPGLLDRMARANVIAERLGIGQVRVFQATFAGPNTGSVYMLYLSDNMVSFAEADAAFNADPEGQALIQELDAAGQAPISSSLSIEITP